MLLLLSIGCAEIVFGARHDDCSASEQIALSSVQYTDVYLFLDDELGSHGLPEATCELELSVDAGGRAVSTEGNELTASSYVFATVRALSADLSTPIRHAWAHPREEGRFELRELSGNINEWGAVEGGIDGYDGGFASVDLSGTELSLDWSPAIGRFVIDAPGALLSVIDSGDLITSLTASVSDAELGDVAFDSLELTVDSDDLSDSAATIQVIEGFSTLALDQLGASPVSVTLTDGVESFELVSISTAGAPVSLTLPEGRYDLSVSGTSQPELPDGIGLDSGGPTIAVDTGGGTLQIFLYVPQGGPEGGSR